MKHLIYIFAIVVIALTSCSKSNEDKPPMVQFTERIMAQYPNFKSNDIAMQALTDSVNAFGEASVNNQTTFFKGIRFHFVRLIDKPDGTHSAMFEPFSLYAEIDDPTEDGHYISLKMCFGVLGGVSEEMAAKLDGNQDYDITGLVHAWDDKDLLGFEYGLPWFGTFIMKNMTVTPIKAE